jgi:hypothetical protein
MKTDYVGAQLMDTDIQIYGREWKVKRRICPYPHYEGIWWGA